MLLSDEEKKGKLEVLGEISRMLAEKDGEMIAEKRKKPKVIEAEVTKLEPMSGDEGSMDEVGSQDESEPGPEEIAMIKDLYHRYCG